MSASPTRPEPPAGERLASRRAVLGGAVLGGGALALAACGAPATSTVTTEWVRSGARGRRVRLVLLRPRGDVRGLPVCLLLHGLHGHASPAILPGLASRLAAPGSPRLAFAAVDGGDDYWHRVSPGDDPMRMLLDEVPDWLATRGFARVPFAVAGVSMGGFGALLYARRRLERGDPVRAVAAVSPGLLTSWARMSRRHAFAGPRQWARLDPLRHPHALGGTPTGIWCGTSDPFVDGTRRYIATARPAFTWLRPGGHDGRFWASCVPTVLRFVAEHRP